MYSPKVEAWIQQRLDAHAALGYTDAAEYEAYLRIRLAENQHEADMLVERADSDEHGARHGAEDDVPASSSIIERTEVQGAVLP